METEELEEECGEPCDYFCRCDKCEPYWERMIREGYYYPGSGWTRKALKEATKF